MKLFKLALFFFLSLNGVCVSFAQAENCASLEEIRDSYLQNDKPIALKGLLCRKANNPEDVESRRFLSDAYWWAGNVDASITEATEAYALLNDSQDFLLTTHLYDRLHRYRAYLEFTNSRSNSTNGKEFSASIDTRYFQKNHIGLEFKRLTRSFSGGPLLYDSQSSLTHTFVFSKNFYLLSGLSATPSPKFLPSWVLSQEPHFLLSGGQDLGLGIKVSKYTNVKPTLALSPQLGWFFGDTAALTPRLNFVFAPEKMVVSGQTSLNFFLGSHWMVNLTPALGKSYEGGSIFDSFWSIGAGIRYRISELLALRPNFSFYHGTIRKQSDASLLSEWIF